jgi:hypothetical protein
MSLPHFVILKNESPDDHLPWIDACKLFPDKLTFEILDLTKNDWLDHLLNLPTVECLLAKPGGLTAPFKQLYDERIIILAKELGFTIYPSLDEILIYENKRYLSYWLKAHGVPHPATYVFYNKDEAENFINNTSFPVVAKKNIGASGSGVEILKSKTDALKYIHNAFKHGVSSQTGPRLDKGKLFSRAWRKLTHPSELKKRISIYKNIANDLQTGFVIFQEFIYHDFEWRVVRIGESFFAHKKIVRNEKASGLLLKGYENPPFELLNFVKEITDKFSFYSQAADIFESPGGYLINELQCIFGQSDPYQMLVNGKPGRYIYKNDRWVFEEGMFNTNKSYDLRMKSILEKGNR